jgi:hypothetical protein
MLITSHFIWHIYLILTLLIAEIFLLKRLYHCTKQGNSYGIIDINHNKEKYEPFIHRDDAIDEDLS